MPNIYVEHPYLSHLLFGSHDEDRREIFSGVTPYVKCFSNELNALLILQSLVAQAFKKISM